MTLRIPYLRMFIEKIRYQKEIDASTLEALRLLIKEYPKDLNDPYEAILHKACEAGSLQLVEALYRYGADINLRDERCGGTPLMYACLHGHSGVVKFLLEKVPNLHLTDNAGQTALDIAKKNDKGAICILLEKAIETKEEVKKSCSHLEEKPKLNMSFNYGGIMFEHNNKDMALYLKLRTGY